MTVPWERNIKRVGNILVFIKRSYPNLMISSWGKIIFRSDLCIVTGTSPAPHCSQIRPKIIMFGGIVLSTYVRNFKIRPNRANCILMPRNLSNRAKLKIKILKPFESIHLLANIKTLNFWWIPAKELTELFCRNKKF